MMSSGGTKGNTGKEKVKAGVFANISIIQETVDLHTEI